MDHGDPPRSQGVITLGVDLPIGREVTVTTLDNLWGRHNAKWWGARCEEGDSNNNVLSLLLMVPDSVREESHLDMIK